jgi:hypothetical protein
MMTETAAIAWSALFCWFYDALVNSDVLVTNMRGSYNEHLAAHAVAFLLA